MPDKTWRAKLGHQNWETKAKVGHKLGHQGKTWRAKLGHQNWETKAKVGHQNWDIKAKLGNQNCRDENAQQKKHKDGCCNLQQIIMSQFLDQPTSSS